MRPIAVHFRKYTLAPQDPPAQTVAVCRNPLTIGSASRRLAYVFLCRLVLRNAARKVEFFA
jgi:hypothetical protein